MKPELPPAATTTFQRLRTTIPSTLLTYLPATSDLEHAPSSRAGFLPLRMHIGVFSSDAPRFADYSAWLYFTQATTPTRRVGSAPPVVVYAHDEVRDKWAQGAVNLASELEWIELDMEFWACENAKDIRVMARWYLMALKHQAGDWDFDAGDVPWSKELEGDICRLAAMFRQKKPDMDQLKIFKAPEVERSSSVDREATKDKPAEEQSGKSGFTPLQAKVDASSTRVRIPSSGPSDEHRTATPAISTPDVDFSDTTDSDSGSSCRISEDPTILDQRTLNITSVIEQHHNVLMDIRQHRTHIQSQARKERKYGKSTKKKRAAREMLLGMMEKREMASEEAIRVFEEQRKWR